LLANLAGRSTDEALAAIAAGLARADAARDPSGMQLVLASQMLARGDIEAAYEVLSRVVAIDDSDVLAMSTLVLIDVATHRTDEATALTRRLHDHYPDLVFGADLADAYRRSGRARAAVAAVEAWVAAAPENLSARVELARLSALAGDVARAGEQARATLVIHGERAGALPELFEAMVASNEVAGAHRIADRMLIGDELARARGRYRVAMVAVLEGRFAAAYDAVRRAIVENRAFAFQSELAQCLELARALAPLVGDVDAQRGFCAELASVFEDVVGDPATAAATRFELALLERRGGPPSLDEALHGLEHGPSRDVARRRMLRAAAVADCGSPHKAVAAGFSAFEDNAASLVALGMCALRLHEHELARASFERASHTWSAILSNQCSAYHAVLARFHLGVTAVELGEIAAARVAFEAFLTAWGDADRPIPEVATARTLLAQLR
jgi:tetratricopeptide (TPR) repeat protein